MIFIKKISRKNEKKTGKICQIFPTCDTKKNNIFKKYLHMGDLEKNDTMFWKMSFHMFCRQIYQIHDSKYETDDAHDCKYLPIFISFTIDNLVDNILDCCMFYH